jgi:hypothetical protein
MPDGMVRTTINLMKVTSIEAIKPQFKTVQKERKQNSVLKKASGQEDLDVDNVSSLLQKVSNTIFLAIRPAWNHHQSDGVYLSRR